MKDITTHNNNLKNNDQNKDIDKIELLKILFKKLLSDNKIDGAEKALFGEFKTAFEISDQKYSQVLAETVSEIKENGNIFSDDGNLDENGREYKIAIYREAYYRMLLNGKISESENNLLIELNKILKLSEDAEGEAVLAANALIIDDAVKCVNSKNYNDALKLLLSFAPDKKHYPRYYQTAYSIFKNACGSTFAAYESGNSPAVEFEKYFPAGHLKEKAPWEALYYHARLIPAGGDGARNKRLLEVLDAAGDDGKKHLTYFQIAFCYQAENNYQKALENYLAAEKYDASDADTAANIISCCLSLKKYEDALKYADEKIDKFSGSAPFFNNCAIAHLKNNDKSRAKELFSKALAVDPDFSDARFNLSKIK
jgi:tetratricopeptide (TPR) repeat protein